MIAIAERTFGLLALVAIVIGVGTTILLVRGHVPERLRDDVALPLATAIAAVATGGSLFLSEVAGYVPCTLCWYQRIAMYPLVVVVGIAAARREREVWRTVLPITAIGSVISVWHILIERNPQWAGPCEAGAPCSLMWVEELGFLTLPTMALIAFIAVTVLTLAARRR